jgi:Tfp pilus assembly protein PilF
LATGRPEALRLHPKASPDIVFPRISRQICGFAAVITLLAACLNPCAFQAEAQSATNANAVAESEIRIKALEGIVEISPAGATAWIQIQSSQVVHAFDRIRTGSNGRITLLWSDQSTVTFDALTELEILPPQSAQSESGLHLLRGIFSFFHRDKPSRIRVITSGAVAGILGTEFAMAVDIIPNSERTTLSVVDGRVRFGNDLAELVLTNGQQAVAEIGKAPALTAGFDANNLLQWCFYYPAVLNLDDLPLSSAEQSALADSLKAYREGDLLAALAKFRTNRTGISDAEAIYHAALLLSVGRVEQTEKELARLESAAGDERIPRLAKALRTLIAAVMLRENPSSSNPQLSTELLAASYYAQSRGTRETALVDALAFAKRAAANAPQFGFAWARVAELEFSFGRTGRALENLNKALDLSPRNAQALALKGFLLAAQNRPQQAISWFERAIAADSFLANAWLGRGLCRIHCGDSKGGREDLLVAASLEPRRALLRSYLGKAYGNEGDFKRANKELELARELDPNDPTPWLYSALLKQQQNRVNEAIGDLEKSQDLNENRSVYRSSLLLDQDRAVRSANLAAIYRDAGMFDVSVREASRAVSYDYANYSAHLFLASSYDLLRDPNRLNLRYETPAQSEYLIANVLAPAGGGVLSQAISQQEYSPLFERDHLGVISSTEYLSRGAWTERGSQYGILGNSSYALEALYHSDPGQYFNNDFEERSLSIKLKQEITPHDILFGQADYYEAAAGDVHQYYDPKLPFPDGPNPSLRTQEHQDPIISLGYSHEWSPGVYTLVLGSRLSDRISVQDSNQVTYLVNRTPAGLDYVEPFFIEQRYRSVLEIYSAELQQILEMGSHTAVMGGRFQMGDFTTKNLQFDPTDTPNAPFITPDPETPAQDVQFTTHFERESVYGYDHWHLTDRLLIVGGLAYDRVTFPKNFRAAPISSETKTIDQVSPKGGFIWTPFSNTIVRAAYAQSLSGASIDQSWQLEPSQIAGFLQSFRSILPESVGGAEAGAKFETYGVSLEQKFETGTYLGLSLLSLHSDINRTIGVFDLDFSAYAHPASTPENLKYQENSMLLTFDQLIGRELSVGGHYRLAKAELEDRFTDVLAGVDIQDPSVSKGFRRNQDLEAVLHELELHVIYQHPSGIFGVFESLWYRQNNTGYQPDRPGDNFWQINLFGGYRFPGRKIEIRLGVLNVTDKDYRLNPLTLYNELPRDRTFFARLQFNL